MSLRYTDLTTITVSNIAENSVSTNTIINSTILPEDLSEQLLANGNGTEIIVNPSLSQDYIGQSYRTLEDAVAFANGNATQANPYIIKINAGELTVQAPVVITSSFVSIHGEGYAESTIIADDALAGQTFIHFNISSSPRLINGRLKDIRITATSLVKNTLGSLGVLVEGDGIFYFDSTVIRDFDTNIRANYTGGVFQRLLVQDSFISQSITDGVRLSGSTLVAFVNTNISSVGSGNGITIEDTATLFYEGGEISNLASFGNGTGLNFIGGGGFFNHFISSCRVNSLDTGLRISAAGQPAQTIEAVGLIFENNSNLDAWLTGENVILDSNASILDLTKVFFDVVNPISLEGTIRNRAEGAEGLVYFERLSIGTPITAYESAFGQGNSYNNNALYQSFDGSTFTDVLSDLTNIDDGNTYQYPNLSLDTALYISNSYQTTFTGIDIVLTQGATLGGGDIVFEYWDGSTWSEFNHMISKKEPPNTPFANSKFEVVADTYEVRFDSEIENDWVTNDPASLGANTYWIRLRISSAITTSFIADQIRIHVSSSKFGSDGTLKRFGKSRSIKKLPVTFGNFNAAAISPANADIYVSDTLFAGRAENRFDNGTTDGTGLAIIVPYDLDTSCPLRVRINSQGINTNPDGDILWELRWAEVTEGGDIYTGTQGPPVAPNQQSIQETQSVTTAGYRRKTRTAVFEIEIPTVIPQIPNGIGGDLLFIVVARLGNDPLDTYDGNIAINDISFEYTSWRDGGHVSAL